MGLPPYGPEPYASANSATPAKAQTIIIYGRFVCKTQFPTVANQQNCNGVVMYRFESRLSDLPQKQKLQAIPDLQPYVLWSG